MVLLRVVGLRRAAETAAIVLLALAGVLPRLLISTLFLAAFVTIVSVSIVGSALWARVRILVGLLRLECVLISSSLHLVAILFFVEKAWFRSLESDLFVVLVALHCYCLLI